MTAPSTPRPVEMPSPRDERRELEPGQIENSEWFRALADTTSTAIFVYRDRFLYANRAALDLVGFASSELLARHFFDLVHPDDRATVRERGQARLRGEEVPTRYEFKVLRADGEVRWLDFTAGVIIYDGAPAGLGTAFDITEHKRALAALSESEERLRQAQESARIVTWEWRVASDELMYSPFASELFGIPTAQLGKTAREFVVNVHPDDHDRFLGEVWQAVKTGEPLSCEVRFATDQGVRWVLEEAKPERGPDGRTHRLLGAAHDITRRKQAELALRASEEQYRLLVENQAELVAKLDGRGRLSFVSPSFCHFFARGATELLGQQAPFLTDNPTATGGDDPSRVLRRLIVPPHSIRFERRIQGRSGWRWISWSCTALVDERGQVGEILAVGRDSTERKLAEEALYEEKERAQVTLAAIGDAVVRTDAQGRVDYLNPVAERLTGWSLAQAYGKAANEILELLDEPTRRPVASPLERSLREGRPIQDPGEVLLVSRERNEALVHAVASPLRDRRGELRGSVLVLSDLTPLRTAEREMTYLASHDPQTGVWNRRAFEQRLEQALGLVRGGGGPIALLYLDLDEFKLINDTCGHLAGDHVVKQLAEILASNLGPEDVLARLGGDEFGILLAGAAEDGARRRAADLVAAVSARPFVWQERSFDVAVSVGLVPLSAANSDWANVLATADAACYAAKETGKARVHVYQPDDSLLAARYGEMQWIHRIRQAFAEDRFRLYYQPIHPLGRRGDLEPLGEILIRMVSETGEMVPAASFIRAAERYHLAPLIDRWVTRHALRHLARDESSFDGPPPLFAINLSGQSLGEEQFLDHVVGELEASSADPTRICFEVTETAAIANLAKALRFIGVLKGMGCRFVLDDFGSGLSSFAYLKNLPVDFLKIDGEFVRSIDADPLQRTLVESINHIGHAIGIRTIAESVETEAIHDSLVGIGVDYGQGYWLSRPAPLT